MYKENYLQPLMASPKKIYPKITKKKSFVKPLGEGGYRFTKLFCKIEFFQMMASLSLLIIFAIGRRLLWKRKGFLKIICKKMPLHDEYVPAWGSLRLWYNDNDNEDYDDDIDDDEDNVCMNSLKASIWWQWRWRQDRHEVLQGLNVKTKMMTIM